MNSMGGQLGAMLSGLGQGNAQAQSILPNVYQPQGKAKAQNPWQGSLDLICDQLLGLGKQIKDQGDKFRSEGDEIYGLCYKLAKVNQRLTDIAQEGSDSE